MTEIDREQYISQIKDFLVKNNLSPISLASEVNSLLSFTSDRHESCIHVIPKPKSETWTSLIKYLNASEDDPIFLYHILQCLKDLTNNKS